jgi:hypothetical protein
VYAKKERKINATQNLFCSSLPGIGKPGRQTGFEIPAFMTIKMSFQKNAGSLSLTLTLKPSYDTEKIRRFNNASFIF